MVKQRLNATRLECVCRHSPKTQKKKKKLFWLKIVQTERAVKTLFSFRFCWKCLSMDWRVCVAHRTDNSRLAFFRRETIVILVRCRDTPCFLTHTLSLSLARLFSHSCSPSLQCVVHERADEYEENRCCCAVYMHRRQHEQTLVGADELKYAQFIWSAMFGRASATRRDQHQRIGQSESFPFWHRTIRLLNGQFICFLRRISFKFTNDFVQNSISWKFNEERSTVFPRFVFPLFRFFRVFDIFDVFFFFFLFFMSFKLRWPLFTCRCIFVTPGREQCNFISMFDSSRQTFFVWLHFNWMVYMPTMTTI